MIGAGGAGLSAAIAAHDAGAKVLVLEKTFLFADNEMDASLVKVFCERAAKLPEFFQRIAPEGRLRVTGHANYPALPHADNITKYRVADKKMGGVELVRTLLKAVEEDRGIPVLTNAAAKELIRQNGAVAGAVVSHGGKTIRVHARKGVILACGGYEYDKQSLQNFCQGTQILGLGNPGNTGDGLRMAAAMGAHLWHMTSYSCPLGIRIPGCKAAVFVTMMTPNYIMLTAPDD